MASDDYFQDLIDLDLSDLVPTNDTWAPNFDLSLLEWMPAPQLSIETQPQPCFVYSFESEIGKIESKIVKISLKFENFDPDTDYVIMCQLSKSSMDGKLSQHRIFEHRQTSGTDSYKPLLKQMRLIDNALTADFELYIVETAKRNDATPALVAKYTELHKLTNSAVLTSAEMTSIENRAKMELSKSAGEDIDELCFSFTVYETCISPPMQRIAGPIFSNVILSGMRIRKICNPTGSINGGTSVTLLLKNKIQNNVKVRFYKSDWEAYVENTELSDLALTFEAPRYDGEWPDEVAQLICHVQIVRPNDNRKSNSVRFTYVNYTSAPDSKQPRRAVDAVRQRQPDTSDGEMAVRNNRPDRQALVADSEESSKSNIASKSNTRNLAPPEHGNSTYHNAIKTGDFLKIYQRRELDEQKCKAINDRRENLLHYACKLDQSAYIRPLIGFRCSVTAQDVNGRTPLHIAIEKGNSDCVDEFVELFVNQFGYPHLAAEFLRLFEIYDAEGHTVLHLAVLNDLRELVGAMLKFSKAVEIDICAIETLGEGDTILHLAESKEIIEIIINNLPEAGRYQNYDGQRAQDSNDQIAEVVEMMAQASIDLSHMVTRDFKPLANLLRPR